MNFHVIKPAEACTAVEQWIETGVLVKNKSGQGTFSGSSMTEGAGRVLLGAPQFLKNLREIRRVLSVTTPTIVDGSLVLPGPGFDERVGTYTDQQAPELKLMKLGSAKQLLADVLRDFPFDSKQSAVHALARLLTPLCRGIMGWDSRVPFWIFTANRERLGKDYLAGITPVVYDGAIHEDAPLEPRNTGETRKRITSALMAGRQRMHFGNCRGHISDPALEQAITAKNWSDRVLGGNQDVSLPNELEFSMSGNIGVSYTADLAHRSRRIGLVYNGEDANQRQFTRPELHRWLRDHRAEVLSALFTLITHWHASGCPDGSTPFSSFPEWARVVGGVMHCADLGDPCLPDANANLVGGDEETTQMRQLLALGHEKFGTRRVSLSSITEMLANDELDGLFPWLNLAERSDLTRFGKMLRRYADRSMGGIVLRIYDPEKRRPQFSFLPQEGCPPPSRSPVEDMFGRI